MPGQRASIQMQSPGALSHLSSVFISHGSNILNKTLEIQAEYFTEINKEETIAETRT